MKLIIWLKCYRSSVKHYSINLWTTKKLNVNSFLWATMWIWLRFLLMSLVLNFKIKLKGRLNWNIIKTRPFASEASILNDWSTAVAELSNFHKEYNYKFFYWYYKINKGKSPLWFFNENEMTHTWHTCISLSWFTALSGYIHGILILLIG